MAAPKGNQFWKLRSKHGRDKIFTTPDIMLTAACEYFEWCEKHPLIELDYRGSSPPVKIELPKMRAYTIEGLTMYLHVNKQYFNDFEKGLSDKKDEISKDFSLVITHVKEVIYNQKYIGAAAGFLNPNIIARDLGLSDRQELTGKDGKDLNARVTIELIDRSDQVKTEDASSE